MIAEVLVDLSLPKIMSTIVNDSIYAATVEEGLAVVSANGIKMILLVFLGGLVRRDLLPRHHRALAMICAVIPSRT